MLSLRYESLGMPSLTEAPAGQLKSRTRRRSLMHFLVLGTVCRGDSVPTLNGMQSNGPANAPCISSVSMYLSTSSGYFTADEWLDVEDDGGDDPQ